MNKPEYCRKCIIIHCDLRENYDDGRSKAFFCRSCALLPLQQLEEIRDFTASLPLSLSLKEKSKQIRDRMTQIADTVEWELHRNKSADKNYRGT